MIIDDENKKIEEKSVTTKLAPAITSDVQDVDLGFVEKKKFRIAGDFSRMIELNVSDLNIFSRYKTAAPKLDALLHDAQEKMLEVNVDDDGVDLNKIADALDDIDAQMRDLIDYLFDSPVSQACAPSGNMFDPVDGDYRFNRIINKLADLYTTGLAEQIKEFDNKTSKHTKKYKRK